MDRAIPNPGNEEIELYMRTYYSLLRSSGEIQVRSLEETHSGANASLHQRADNPELDLGAFAYCALRLPPCIPNIRLILLGQSSDVFSRAGYPNVLQWTGSRSPARRRKMFFDDKETMAVFINSISDIDDLVPMLTAYQIEWNKLHTRLLHAGFSEQDNPTLADYRAALSLSEAEFETLHNLWGKRLLTHLQQVAHSQKRFAVRLLAGSRTDYRRATEDWWQSLVAQCPIKDLKHRPVYFVSSNMHVLPNLLFSYAGLIKDEVLSFLTQTNPEGLLDEYQRLEQQSTPGLVENLLYYVMRKYMKTPAGRHHYDLRLKQEMAHGIHNTRRPHNLDVEAQVIDLNKLNPAYFDVRGRLPGLNWDKLSRSRAVIINVDYPLGMAAYHVLSQVSANVGEIRAVYILGKAASLNARVGDVMVPNIVYDDHSQNTYLFRNCFSAHDVAPFLKHGTVFDNQKAVTVRGTLLQNRDFMHIFYKEGYTDIEMEAGHYLNALYENVHPKRYPTNEIINLFQNLRYDIGILHYTSDTPYSKRQSLLSKSLLYFGMDSTYASAIAIVRRILAQEVAGG